MGGTASTDSTAGPTVAEGLPYTAVESETATDPLSAAVAHIEPGSPSGRGIVKRMSVASMEVANELDSIADNLSKMQLTCDEADTVLADISDCSQLPVGLRNDLAQLHGNANRLLATRLDAIITGDLNTGKTEARSRRKAMIQTTEQLIERVEAQVKRIDRLLA